MRLRGKSLAPEFFEEEFPGLLDGGKPGRHHGGHVPDVQAPGPAVP